MATTSVYGINAQIKNAGLSSGDRMDVNPIETTLFSRKAYRMPYQYNTNKVIQSRVHTSYVPPQYTGLHLPLIRKEFSTEQNLNNELVYRNRDVVRKIPKLGSISPPTVQNADNKSYSIQPRWRPSFAT